MTTYTIEIDETQRDKITDALRNVLDQDVLDGELMDPKEREELEILHQMFRNLPQDEEESPGATHGFCL